MPSMNLQAGQCREPEQRESVLSGAKGEKRVPGLVGHGHVARRGPADDRQAVLCLSFETRRSAAQNTNAAGMSVDNSHPDRSTWRRPAKRQTTFPVVSESVRCRVARYRVGVPALGLPREQGPATALFPSDAHASRCAGNLHPRTRLKKMGVY